MDIDGSERETGVPATEDGIVIGNTYDKYGATNPIARRLTDGFLAKFDHLVSHSEARNVHEVGCGEGKLSIRMASNGADVRGSDFSSQIIEEARDNATAAGVVVPFKVASIYDLDPNVDAASLIVSSEVLEHLEHPEQGLDMLAALADPWLLVSVPREPVWRALNMARAKYLNTWGNTPGHLQHWSKRSFLDFLGSRVDVIVEDSPFPWTMALCKTRP